MWLSIGLDVCIYLLGEQSIAATTVVCARRLVETKLGICVLSYDRA